MRYREVQTDKNLSNRRTPMVNRDGRSHLFVAMEGGPLFAVPDLDSTPYIPMLIRPGDEAPAEGDDPIDARAGLSDQMVAPEKDPERGPVRTLPEDSVPPVRPPLDARVGSPDHAGTEGSVPPRRYDVTGTTTTRSLNVTSPTVANCARVLSAVLEDLQERGLLTRVAS